jgi:hypothetical protein
MCRVYESKWSDTAHISNQNSEPARSEFTQVMNASEMSTPNDTPNYYYPEPNSWMIDHEVSHVKPEEDDIIVIPENFKRVFFGQDDTEFAGMSNPEKRHDGASGMLMVDCCATTTITESFFNMTSMESRVITIQLAMSGATMQSTHVGMKTYYFYDRTGIL